MWNRKPKPEPEVKCEHDECAECYHLISKGSGQEVVTEYRMIIQYGGLPFTKIYCDLHKKPYDKITVYYNGTTIYEKKVEPWKRVNEDGTDYKEPKKPPTKRDT